MGPLTVCTFFGMTQKSRTYNFGFSSHAVPEWFDPLSAQNSEDHHEGMKEIGEVPPETTEKDSIWWTRNTRYSKALQFPLSQSSRRL